MRLPNVSCRERPMTAVSTVEVAMRPDTLNPERFVHDSRFVLVDKQRHIRGYYEGTTMEGMNALAADLKMLLKEEKIKAAERTQAERDAK